MATGAVAEVVEIGIFGAGQFIPCDELSAGMVGYITASIKMCQIRALEIPLQIITDHVRSHFLVIKKVNQWYIVDCIQQMALNIKI